ncbi:uncharacterized protein LOC134216571 [Armigeres subalbatus]|uniref:uncharacterized protein LOC134216571 n=1 Tax=Armigeres subalbatus TaxID=124917 RepID=UPI002ED06798
MFKFLLIVALVPAITLAGVSFRPCPNNAPLPKSLTVNDCIGNDCVLVAKKSLYSVGVGLIGRFNSKTATTKLIARSRNGGDLGFKTPRGLVNACNGSISGGCPIVAGKAFNYSVYIDVLDIPAINLPVEIEVNLTGDSGVPLTCARFNARISRR